jgi:WD40 repeat protein
MWGCINARISQLEGHAAPYSLDIGRFVSESRGDTELLWDKITSRYMRLSWSTKDIQYMVRMVTEPLDGNLCLWDQKTDTVIAKVQGHLESVAVLAGGAYFLSWLPGKVLLLNSITGVCIANFVWDLTNGVPIAKRAPQAAKPPKYALKDQWVTEFAGDLPKSIFWVPVAYRGPKCVEASSDQGLVFGSDADRLIILDISKLQFP